MYEGTYEHMISCVSFGCAITIRYANLRSQCLKPKTWDWKFWRFQGRFLWRPAIPRWTIGVSGRVRSDHIIWLVVSNTLRSNLFEMIIPTDQLIWRIHCRAAETTNHHFKSVFESSISLFPTFFHMYTYTQRERERYNIYIYIYTYI